MSSAQQIINELNLYDEHHRIEAKECTDKIDKSVLETICSFSNEPDLGGGRIIIGVAQTGQACDYTAVGVNDPDKLQKDLASQCSTMFNHPVRPQVTPDMVDGRKVLVVDIPELDNRLKPLYFVKEGLPRGAWRRIGSTDQRCSEEDLAVFYAVDDFDTVIAEDTDMDDLDENAIRLYRKLRAEVNPAAEELSYDNKTMLRALGAVKKDKDGFWRLTNTGLIVFGKQMSLRRVMPLLRVDYIRVPGTEWVPDPRHRFDSIDMRGPLISLVNRAYNSVADDLPRGFSLKPGNLQADRPLSIPDGALREAITNALMHQNLRRHRPIQIIRYSNRIEIINPGYSLKKLEDLGEPGSETRNQSIASIFHDTNLAEAKGTGINTMRRLMKEAGLLPPTFESDHSRNIFTARILLCHLIDEEDAKWLATPALKNFNESQKTGLIFLKEVGALDVPTYRQLTGESTKRVAGDLKQLLTSGFLSLKGQGRGAYYVATPELIKIFNLANKTYSESYKESSDAYKGSSDAYKGSSSINIAGIKGELSEDIQQNLSKIGKRAKTGVINSLILQICSERDCSMQELSLMLGRSEKYVQTLISGMVKSGKLQYTIPDMINHPNQKYKTH